MSPMILLQYSRVIYVDVIVKKTKFKWNY